MNDKTQQKKRSNRLNTNPQHKILDDNDDTEPQRTTSKSVVNEIEFSVDYISLPPRVSQYMNRNDDDAYALACGKLFKLPLFPLKMNLDMKQPPHKEYQRLSRIVTAVRVRRLVLSNQITELSLDMKKYSVSSE